MLSVSDRITNIEKKHNIFALDTVHLYAINFILFDYLNWWFGLYIQRADSHKQNFLVRDSFSSISGGLDMFRIFRGEHLMPVTESYRS